MAFTIQMSAGQERSAFTVVGSGTPTGNIDVIVDTGDFDSTQFPGNGGRKHEAIRLLREAANLIESGDWPLA